MSKLGALLQLSRPKQWTKNLFVFAGVIFSGQLFSEHALTNSLITFVYFCIASSLVYVLNDIVDIERDKLHPKKSKRPLPSGKIEIGVAWVWFLFLALVFVSGYVWSPTIMIVPTIYFGINIAYSFILKHLLFIDIFTIALGFVLRVVAGTVAVNVSPSPWLLLCTLLLALYLGLGKRRNELLLLEVDEATSHRGNLKSYAPALINQWMSITSSTTIITYSLYTFSAFDHLWMMVTIPFVIYGLFRYQYLVEVQEMGGSPEYVIYSDLPFFLNGLIWIMSVIVIFYLL